MVCDFRKVLAGWRMKVKFALGGTSREMPLESFLAGAEPVRTRLKMAETGCQLGANSRLTMSGSAQAEFLPNWTLRLEGKEIATLTGMGRGVVSDTVTLALLDEEAPSLMQKPLPRRTLIVLDRGKYEWAVDLAPKDSDHGRLISRGLPFNAVEIEAGERSSALLARGEEDGNGLVFQPSSGLTGEDGRRFELGLRNARYAVAFEDGAEQAVLLADFQKEPVWLHTNGCSLRLGHAEDAAFEVHSRNGRVQRLRCEPALVAFAAPLPDAIVEAAPTAPGTRLAFVGDGTRLAAAATPTMKLPTVIKPLPGATATPAATDTGKPTLVKPPGGAVRVKPGAVGILALSAPPVTVIRPEDLLNLTFEFINLQFTSSGGATKLTRQKQGSPAFIVVKFPPQNIAEQAFWETAASGKTPPPPPGKTDPTGEEAPTVPAFAVMSQPSRLVFALPAGTDSIDYTLAALLDWGKYTPSVSIQAQPGPNPPPKAIRGTTGMTIQGVQPGVKVAPGTGGAGKPKTPLKIPGIPHFMSEDLTGPVVGAQLPVMVKPDTARPVGAKPAAVGPAAEKVTPGIIAPVHPGIIAAMMSPSEPQPFETAIEAPYRLILSPHAGVGWAHSQTPVSTATEENDPNRFELWHTRMGVRLQDGTVDETDDWYRTVRAIWTPDYTMNPKMGPVQAGEPGGPILPGKPNEDQLHNHANWPDYRPGAVNPDGFRMSLSRDDRVQIVWLTGDGTIKKGFQERVVRANNFMLSSLGAWMDTRYAYDLDTKGLMSTDTHKVSMDLIEWVHKAAMGRDSYVRVVYAGYLFPFGHKASLIKITERKIVSSSYGPLACLRQRAYIAVRQPTMNYRNTGLRDTRANPATLVDRQMPFASAEITSLVTPALDIPSSVVTGPGNQTDHTYDWYAFWANVGGQGFPFHVRATDSDGQVVEFKAPMIFVSRATPPSGGAGVYRNIDTLLKIKDAYDKRSGGNNMSQMAGQKLAFADPAQLGDTRLECQTMTFSVYIFEKQPAEGNVAYTPTVDKAQVRIPAAAALMKTSDMPEISLAGPYVQGVPNPGKVFAALTQAAGFSFPSDKAGGLVTPDLSITGLSGQFGPIGGALDKFAGGNFDPMEYFKNAMPKLLGTVSLADIIDAIFGELKIPGLTHEVEQENGIPTGITVEFKWEPDVHPWPNASSPFLGITKPIFDHMDPGDPSKHIALVVHAKVHVSLKDGGDASASIEASLTNFGLNLLPLFGYDYFIKVTFKELSFKASDSEKADVTCDLGDIKFGGPLAFIDELRKYIPLDGFKDPPYLDVDTSGIKLGYTLELPTIGVGIFSLSNLSLGAGVAIPFLGNDGVSLTFDFCKREAPFCLTYTIFGGGGFFGCQIGIDGLKMIEASFEFGGNFSFDIGIASGGAHIMAGVYFKLEGGGVTLEGYVRLGGNLSVLGLIRISIEFYLSLTYISDSSGSSVWGHASVDVEIDIFFFSFSVSLSVERRFAGSGGSPSSWLPDGTRLAMATDSVEGYAQLPTIPKAGSRARPVKSGTASGVRPALGGPREAPLSTQDFISQDQWKAYCDALA